MLKKFIFLMMACLLSIAVNAQTWNSFGSKAAGSAPEMNLLTSTAQSIGFEVAIPGIYATDTIVNGVAFMRLNLSSGFAVNPAGSPEFSFYPVRCHSKISVPLRLVIINSCFNEIQDCYIICRNSVCISFNRPNFHNFA